MDLKELHDFKLSDALYFHTDLNQAIFDGDHMNDKVRQQLLIIADDFIEHLGIDDLDVKDITLSGSNAAYSYTKHSDIDLHILVDMTRFTDDDVYRELFDAKKIVYNDQHDIIINGYEVELYVQDANEPVISLGEYSILNNKWIKLPRKRKANLDQVAAKAKFKKIAKLAEFALRSNSYEKIQGVLKTIKKYRQAGLDLNGEFGPENLAFKALRTQGIIKRLYEKLDELHSERLSLPESKVKRNDLADSLANEFTRFKTEDCDPTYNVNESKIDELANSSLKVKEPKDLVNTNDRKQVTYKVMKFKSGKNKFLINFTVKGAPAFGKKSNWNAVNVAFGVREEQDDYSFGDEMNTDLTAKNKNQFLIYSTVINAIRKFITEYNTEIDEIIIQGAGERQLMMYQRFFRVAPKYFPGWHYDGKHSLVRDVPRQQVKKEDVSEASGYIPSEKEKNDPRFETALSVDVKPDSIKKNASAFNFKVSRAGIPPLLRK